jgi:hypothetical protein
MVRQADVEAARFGWMATVDEDHNITNEELQAVYCVRDQYVD